MSFSSDVKKELSAIEFTDDCCRKAEIFGFSLCCRENLMLNTESNSSARRYSRDIAENYGTIVDIKTDLVCRNVKRQFSVSIPDENELNRVRCDLSAYYPNKSCCKAFALRGAFMAGGTVTDPQKDYHAEISTASQESCQVLIRLLTDLGLKAKQTVRGKCYIVYIKGSESIEDFLGVVGALDSYWKTLQIIVEKDIKNKANRITNCDNANIGRTVAASSQQINAIIKIRDTIGFDKLPDELKEIAQIRLDNPELSLREIGEMLSPPISRSGANHRLQKLVETAKELDITE